MIIIGAGLSGLLAANMLSHWAPTVLERQGALPNNHSAVLRFRGTVVSDVTRIPFKAVKMIKHIVPWRNPVADAMAYADKTSGVLRSDRSITSSENGGVRYIAPTNLIKQLGAKATIKFNTDGISAINSAEPAISTIPMPVLMKALNYPHQLPFTYNHGINITATIDACDAYVSLYFPDPDIPFSRASITGDQLIIEGHANSHPHWDTVLPYLGIEKDRVHHVGISTQLYAKINPLDDDDARREFIFWATNEHNIYSLGRYATWRPGLLLDHLVQDIRLIDKWASKRDRYSIKHRRAM